MKKLLVILLIAFSAVAALSGCSSKYKEGVDIPKGYPDVLEIYDDAIVFEVAEEDDEIKITYGTEDDLDDVVDFYMDAIVESLHLILNDWDEGRDDYIFGGVGSSYDFIIEIEKAEDREARFFDTVVEIEIAFVDEKIDLMEDLQGNWLLVGLDGVVTSEIQRHCMYYKIDENSYEFYENAKSELAETYVFFLEDNQIVTKSGEGYTQPYDIVFEEIEGVDVMSMSSAEHPPQHFAKITEDELQEYEKINETWNNMKGFWHRVGANGAIDDAYKGFAYDFSDYQFNVYVDLDITSAGVMYDFVDSITIEHEMNGETKNASITFETVDSVEVMTIDYGDAIMHFEKYTQEDYLAEVSIMLGAKTLEQMQGLWYLVGINGAISDVQKSLGFAYEFTDSQFDTYNDFVVTNFDTEFSFVSANMFEYTTVSGYEMRAYIDFETIEGVDVMTYTVDSIPYHFIKVSYEEFLELNTLADGDTSDLLPGFWRVVGVNGEIPEEYYTYGFAFEFTETTITSYRSHVPYLDNTPYRVLESGLISFMDPNGTGYTSGIKFETIEGIDVMTVSISSANYHCIRGTYNEMMSDGNLAYAVKGFWTLIGRDGEINDEIEAEGNGVDFTDELVTVYFDYVPNYEIAEVEFKDNDTIKFDVGLINVTAEIEFKTVDGVDVLCATVLMQEYYFVRSTYEEFIANR